MKNRETKKKKQTIRRKTKGKSISDSTRRILSMRVELFMLFYSVMSSAVFSALGSSALTFAVTSSQR